MIKNCKLCNQQFNNIIYHNGILCRSTGRTHCYTCKPFISRGKTIKYCLNCKQSSSISGLNQNGKCRTCALKDIKVYALNYLGNKCCVCGYNKCKSALEFHHRNPKEKEFSIGEARTKNLEKIKAELDKCDLLCANCHREEHERLYLQKSKVKIIKQKID
jgi:hypothetical protein